VGAGGQGSRADQPNSEKIISFAHAIKDHPEFELTGFIDKDLSKAEEAQNKWGAKFASDVISTIQHNDVVIVSTPDDTHYEVLKEVYKKRPSLVICEKPLCTDLEQAKEIVGLYKDTPLMVNYTRRFLPYYDKLKRRGKPIYGVCRFNRGWLHTATHGIDFFNMIGCGNYLIVEDDADYRYWYLGVTFEDGSVFKETRYHDQPVWKYYDKSHYHVIENAYNFLQGKEPIKCDGEMALRALEKCFELMKGKIKMECKNCEGLQKKLDKITREYNKAVKDLYKVGKTGGRCIICAFVYDENCRHGESGCFKWMGDNRKLFDFSEQLNSEDIK
jgi:hypothetical protein